MRLILMKKLLKSEVYGSREQCTGLTDVLKRAEKSNCVATVYELCMNSSRNSENCLLNACQKKKEGET